MKRQLELTGTDGLRSVNLIEKIMQRPQRFLNRCDHWCFKKINLEAVG